MNHRNYSYRYVIFDMWQNGFVAKMGRIIPCIKTRFGTMATIWVSETRGTNFILNETVQCFRIFWCLLTYGMVVLIPHIEDMMSLVGVTGGTTCALVFPPIFEIIVFWTEWKAGIFIASAIIIFRNNANLKFCMKMLIFPI